MDLWGSALGPPPPVPPAAAQVTYAQLTANTSAPKPSTSAPVPPSLQRQPPSTHGLYYGNIEKEANPPVHVEQTHPHCDLSLPTLPPYPDEPFSVYSIERAQCAVLLGRFDRPDMEQLGEDMGDMSKAYVQATRNFLSEKMI